MKKEITVIEGAGQTVGQIVARDYRSAAVFRAHGIDFCCKGNRSLEEVCENKGIAPETLLREIQSATAEQGRTAGDFQSWPLDLLADYIEKKHHRYIARTTPELLQYLDKLCRVHGGRHPELFEIREEFSLAADELAAHMKKEELILFPFVRKLATEERPAPPPFGTVENPVRMMMEEHAVEGDRFEKIARLSDDYTPPSDACTTYRVAFSLLKAFAEDLHLHIHLENNILFPGAVAAELATRQLATH